jgi:hypothetical protein
VSTRTHLTKVSGPIRNSPCTGSSSSLMRLIFYTLTDGGRHTCLHLDEADLPGA